MAAGNSRVSPAYSAGPSNDQAVVTLDSRTARIAQT
jgi:hypothetical protein